MTLELTIRAIYQLANGTSAASSSTAGYIDEALPVVQGLRRHDLDQGDGRRRLGAPRTRDRRDVRELPVPDEDGDREGVPERDGLDAREREAPHRRPSAPIIVLVILLIAANTMAMAARERVTEIAVLRTLGFPKVDDPRRSSSARASLLALVGGALGILLFVAAEPSLKRQLMLTRRCRASRRRFASIPEVLAPGLRARRRRRRPRRARPGPPVGAAAPSPTA